jgi:hypothetical protein
MPNIAAMEPQILVDLLALSLRQANLDGTVGGEVIAVVSPWFSNVELSLHPSGRHGALTSGKDATHLKFAECLQRFCQQGWSVRVGVLKYGHSFAGLMKRAADFGHERAALRGLLASGAQIYLCPNLHAKGIVTPLGVITGSTNYTGSGMHLQMQNPNYFAFDHPDYSGNRATLLAYLHDGFRTASIP